MSKANSHSTILSRRAALAGLSVIAGTAAVPAIADTPASDTKLLALLERRQELLAEAGNACAAWVAATGDCPDEVNDGRYNEVFDIEAAIFSTPAESVVGMLVKLKLAVELMHPQEDGSVPTLANAYEDRDLDNLDWAVCSLWADATRIVVAQS